MRIQHLHDWDIPPEEAIKLQNELADRLIDDRPIHLDQVRTVAGVDVSVRGGISQAAVVVTSFPDLEPLETVRAARPTQYPYIPGLLSFREGPVLAEAFERLQTVPDVLLFDGMGKIHPRRIGIASHMGLWLERPTIGCGKSHLIGEYDLPGEQKGSYSPLTHRGQQLGVVLRTRTKVRPVYISVGHLAELESAVRFVLACTPRYRLPRPIRLAHKAAGQFD